MRKRLCQIGAASLFYGFQHIAKKWGCVKIGAASFAFYGLMVAFQGICTVDYDAREWHIWFGLYYISFIPNPLR